jgi:prepilin-type processing-associated H-X9-DG protein
VGDLREDGIISHAIVIGTTMVLRVEPLPFDYAINEHIYGFGTYAQTNRMRLGGQLSKCRRSAETPSIMDGGAVRVPGEVPNGFVTVEPTNSSPAPTLADALTSIRVDRFRHRNQVNIAFLDGHVESIPLTDDATSKVLMLPE